MTPEEYMRQMRAQRNAASQFGGGGPGFLGPPVHNPADGQYGYQGNGPGFDGGPVRQPPVAKPPRVPGFDGGPIHQGGGQGFQMPKDRSERQAMFSHDKDYARALQAAMKRRQQVDGV
jgi:hypothetical protein